MRENGAQRHDFSLRGLISKNYYGKAIKDRTLIFVAIFLICTKFKILKLELERFRKYDLQGGSMFTPPPIVFLMTENVMVPEGLTVEI